MEDPNPDPTPRYGPLEAITEADFNDENIAPEET